MPWPDPPLAHWHENLEVPSFSQSPIGPITGPCMGFAKLLSSRSLPCSVLTAYLSGPLHSFFTPLSQNWPSVTAPCACCCCLVTSVLPVLQGLPLVPAQGMLSFCPYKVTDILPVRAGCSGLQSLFSGDFYPLSVTFWVVPKC